jgi:hypothetical protein
MRLHRYIFTVVLAAVCSFAFASSAQAATGTISPSGAISARGRLSLGTSVGTIACDVTLNGTLLSSASGTLGGTPPNVLLTTNPIIGSITSGSTANPTSGATCALLFRDPTSWTIRNYALVNGAGGLGSHYIQGAQFLITLPGAACLYRATVLFTTTNGSSTITVGSPSTALQLVVRTGLLSGGTGCPPGTESLRGLMTLTVGGVPTAITGTLIP